LTGGLEEFHSVFPDYIEGTNIPQPKPLGKKGRCTGSNYRSENAGKKENYYAATAANFYEGEATSEAHLRVHLREKCLEFKSEHRSWQ
jgi:hypothetical protein